MGASISFLFFLSPALASVVLKGRENLSLAFQVEYVVRLSKLCPSRIDKSLQLDHYCRHEIKSPFFLELVTPHKQLP